MNRSLGGGEKSAHDFGIPFLGRIPVETEMVKAGDSGRPFIHFKEKTPIAEVMNRIIDTITDYLRNNECKRELYR